MGKVIAFFLLLFTAFNMSAQEVFLPDSGLALHSDAIGNVYVQLVNGEIRKYDNRGNLVGNYRELVLGMPGSFDVSNPLQPLVFYPKFGIVVQLDNMMYEVSRLKVDGLGLSTNSVMCRSYDNNLWFYDERSFRLKKISFDLNIIQEGDNLMTRDVQLLSSGKIRITETNDRVYIYSEDGRFFEFSLFGKFNKTWSLPGKSFHLNRESVLFYLSQYTFKAYFLRTIQETELPQAPFGFMPSDAIMCGKTAVFLSGNRLIFVTQ